MNDATTLMAVNNGWLDRTPTIATGGISQLTTTNCLTPYTSYYYPVLYQSPARPIKLTLSEVERLRKVAKTDEKVKDILRKFTALIEITVDFD